MKTCNCQFLPKYALPLEKPLKAPIKSHRRLIFVCAPRGGWEAGSSSAKGMLPPIGCHCVVAAVAIFNNGVPAASKPLRLLGKTADPPQRIRTQEVYRCASCLLC